MARSLGYENPVGQDVKFMGQTATVRCVVKNFHFNSLRVPITQLMIFQGIEGADMVLVRLNDLRIGETLNAIENKFHEFEKGIPFEYRFMDDLLDEYYRNDHSMEMLSDLFTLIAIIISCTGLFGLALFTTEQRTKEIGIRKTFGSGSGAILVLLVSNFLKWIAISFVISGVISFYVLERWLQGFAYHVRLSIGIFLTAGFLIIFLALITISWKCWNASNRNPLESIRYE
jgi:ABC-type antimicrobial peptide transport system permease subunit